MIYQSSSEPRLVPRPSAGFGGSARPRSGYPARPMLGDDSRLARGLAAWRMFTWTLDLATDQLELSPAADAILELGGRRYRTLTEALRLVHPDDLAMVQALFAGGAPALEGPNPDVRLVSPTTGRTFWVEGRNEAVRDEAGRVVGFWGLITDVTERHLAAEHLRAIAEHTTDVLMRIDTAGILRYLNRAIDPWTVESAIGRHWLELVEPAERGRAAEQMRRVLATGAPIVYETAGHGPGGRRAWCSKQLAPIVEHGEITGALLIARDITEQRDAEERLRVAERLASVGLMAAGVAHEINNPLTALAGNLTLIGRELTRMADPGVAARLGHFVDDAEEAAVRIRDVVRDLAMFSRAEEPRLVPVDLRGVIQSAARLAASEIRHRARLVTELAEVPAVLADPSRVGQVVLNLLINAAQALPGGAADAHEIRIATRPGRGHVVLEVSDTGPGIPSEVLDRLFTPFFTTKPVGEGSGLGLSICHRIVTSFGGTIRAASPPGQGAVFTVELPIAAARSAAAG
jgi:two-component system, cell cycle sensor histidine kinase and response regulator CckA